MSIIGVMFTPTSSVDRFAMVDPPALPP